MAQMSVEQFANELGLLPTVLLEQLQAAGVNKQLVEDSLSEEDKAQLLGYLRKSHGASETKSRVTLTRRQTSEIRKSDNTGRARTIQVEVRKKRVLSKPVEADKVVKPEEVAEPVKKEETKPAKGLVIDEAELAFREQEAKKKAELIARQIADINDKKKRKDAATAVKKEETKSVEATTEATEVTQSAQPT
ncbi:MAG: translation initiation factor IF-2 associated domain-containing protein, partial [Nitrosomonas sp.]|nr:translation initiation factor IF-2 associated domain-containing protein [Nitrosomonas sp.]